MHDGNTRIDVGGSDWVDAKAAVREAIRLSGVLLESEADLLILGEEWRMEVTDAAGLVLFRLDFMLSHAPAAKDLLKT